MNFFFEKDFKYMCDAYETFEELSENEDDPKQLLENLKSKSTKSIVVPLEYHFYLLKSIYIKICLIFERYKRICFSRSSNSL